MRVRIFGLSLGLCLCLCLVIVGSAQSRQGSIPKAGTPTQPTETLPNSPDAMRDHLAREEANKANLARHAALKTDTEKLLKLAEELKQDVEKSNENVLSVNVVKKADEIEKLAKSVKDKMRGPS